MIKLLVALHPGFTHTPAIERVRGIAEKLDVEVMLYGAVYDEHFAGLRFGDGTAVQETHNRIVAAEQRKLEEIKIHLNGVAKKVTVSAEWRFPAAQGINDAAEAFNADLIIISSTQHSVFARWLLTNTDWEVLRHATIPVLLAHHQPFRAYKTVMAAVDPMHTHDEPAALDHKIIERGRWLANYFEGTTHIAHAYPSKRTMVSIEYIPPKTVTDKWLEEHTSAVQALAKQHHVEPPHIHLLDEFVNHAIPDLAKKLSADLVVMGAVSRSFLEGLTIGRTTERVIDHLECDVLVIPAIRHG